MKKKYNMSEKRLEKDRKLTNWERRLEIMRLKIQGWNNQQIGDKFGITRERVRRLYDKTKGKTIEELEELAKKYE